jgi:hypothetical protein
MINAHFSSDMAEAPFAPLIERLQFCSPLPACLDPAARAKLRGNDFETATT